jgi:tetratricopeptide (TPR) repeat protein
VSVSPPIPERHPLICTALALGLCICAVPRPALAGPAKAKASRNAEDPARSRAKELYERGKGQFDTANYAAAIELWTEAYTTLPDTPDNARVKAVLIYNIASAREKAFEIDRDVTQLRQARVLLQSYADAIPQLYGETEEGLEESEKVYARIASLDESIAAAEVQTDVPAPTVADPVEQPTAVEPPEEGLAPLTPAPDPASRKMLWAGGTLVGLGGVSLGVMIAGLVIGDAANDIDDFAPHESDEDLEARRIQFDRGRQGNVMAIAGGVLGGIFVVGGSVLIAVGRARGTRGNAQLRPVVSPTFAGMSLRGRF